MDFHPIKQAKRAWWKLSLMEKKVSFCPSCYVSAALMAFYAA
jgi:hypothetical protein